MALSSKTKSEIDKLLIEAVEKSINQRLLTLPFTIGCLVKTDMPCFLLFNQ